jgi:glycosyltransferase involved in cell wall biosynthesis
LLQRTFRIYDSYFFPGPARQILVWSEWARSEYIRAGIEETRVRVVPPGLLAPEFSSPKKYSQRLRLLFVGNDFARKGGFLLLEAFSQLRDRYGKDIVLTVVSNYDTRNSLPEGVIWRRNLSRLQMQELYREHDVFVLPTYAEGYGISVVEAMSFGLPVIVSTVGALPEIVCQGAGFIVEPGDWRGLFQCLMTLMADKDLLQTMSMQARNCFLQHHDVRNTNVLLGQVYQEVLNASR